MRVSSVERIDTGLIATNGSYRGNAHGRALATNGSDMWRDL